MRYLVFLYLGNPRIKLLSFFMAMEKIYAPVNSLAASSVNSSKYLFSLLSIKDTPCMKEMPTQRTFYKTQKQL